MYIASLGRPVFIDNVDVMSSDSEPSAHWNDLASELGAEPTHDPAPAEKPLGSRSDSTVDPPTEEKDSVKRSKRPRPASNEAPTDWTNLADSLGIEVPEDQRPAPREVEWTPPDHSETTSSDDVKLEVTSDQPVKETPADNSTDSIFTTGVDVQHPAVEIEPADVVSANVEPIEDKAHSAVVGTDTDTDGSSSSSAPSDSQPKRRRRRRRRNGRRDRPSDQQQKSNENVEGDPSVQADSDESPSPVKAESDKGEEQNESGGRSRKPRRRRRRKPKSAPPADRESEDGNPAEIIDETASDIADAAAEAREGHDDLDDADPPVDDEMSDNPSVSHRKITSWEEAVGIIVECNVESRSKSQRSNSPRGRKKK